MKKLISFAFWLAVCNALASAQSTPNTDVAAEFTQGTAALREGNLDQAAEKFESVVKRQPQFAEAYFDLGLTREQQGNHDPAIASLQKALALKPRLHGANLFLGISEFRLNRLGEAAASVTKETEYYPKDATAWMWLGVIRLAQDRPEDAVEALDKAGKLKPDDPDILYHRGRAHLLVSKNSYAKMFKLDSNSWRVHRVMAQASAEADRHVDAIAEYEMAIKLAPAEPGLHEELGTEYRATNKIDLAEEAFRSELQLDPHNVLAIYKLGAIEVERGNGAEGKQLIDAANKQKPNLAHIDYNLGRAEMLVGNDSAAANDFERAVKTDTDPDLVQQAYYQLSQLYRRLHQPEQAQAALANFLKLKQEAAEHQQEMLQRKQSMQEQGEAAPSEPPDVNH